MRLAAVVVVVLSFSAIAAVAQEEPINADRPGLADGSGTVGQGVAQLETGLTVAREEENVTSLPTLFRYGFTDRFELRIASDVFGHFDGETELAPVEAGFKFRITEGGTFPLSLIASVQPPSGGGAFRSDGFETEARLVSDIDLGGGYSLTPNLGVSKGEDSDATAIFAMTLQKELGNALPFVDFETQSGSGDTALIADAGIAWIVRPNTQLDVSFGVDLAGDAYPDWFISAGYSRRF